ncbi:MAG: TOBE domain-containing protein, partial [Patescibacteria group bacterium]|nr:TOBE domain-containing protein [Patescibacteria group bacterium]
LALGPVEHVSVQNQLRGRVRHIVQHAERALCVVDAGPILLVDVTRQAVTDLRLAPGRPIWCLFKANAIRCVAMQRAQGATAGDQSPTPDHLTRPAESCCNPPGAARDEERLPARNRRA